MSTLVRISVKDNTLLIYTKEVSPDLPVFHAKDDEDRDNILLDFLQNAEKYQQSKFVVMDDSSFCTEHYTVNEISENLISLNIDEIYGILAKNALYIYERGKEELVLPNLTEEVKDFLKDFLFQRKGFIQ